MQSRLDRRFFQSTRGRVVALLRRRRHTVDELAQELDLTDNAIRSHLASLERDGIVAQQGVRRGTGKPAYDYELTRDAEALFPKAYEQVLRQLLTVLVAELGSHRTDTLMQQVGKQLATGAGRAEGDARQRVEAGVHLLTDFGGLAELHEEDDGFIIHGFSCPLAGVVGNQPAACRLAESLLSEYIGLPVCERCERGDRPRCQFDIVFSSANQ